MLPWSLPGVASIVAVEVGVVAEVGVVVLVGKRVVCAVLLAGKLAGVVDNYILDRHPNVIRRRILQLQLLIQLKGTSATQKEKTKNLLVNTVHMIFTECAI